ncbi:MAG: AMP-binding protein, partial [Saccharothrix sp.]|nr:AMP-binding protein [Saccharothrix sp.]
MTLWEHLTSGDAPALGTWSAAGLRTRVTEAAEAVGRHEVAGAAVALRMPYGAEWVVAFLALLRAGARPLLVSPDAPDAEVVRLLDAVGGGRWMEGFAPDGVPRLRGEG